MSRIRWEPPLRPAFKRPNRLVAPAGSPPFATLTDAFSTLDSAKWTASGGAALDSGNVKLPVLSSYAATLQSVGHYDLTGSYVYGQMTLPAVGAGTREVTFEAQLDASNKLLFVMSGGPIFGRVTVGGVNTTQNLLTTDNWWRLSESGGTVGWDTSTDGLSWTNRWTQSRPSFGISSLYLLVNAGYYGAESAADSWIDNVNTPAPIWTPNVIVIAPPVPVAAQSRW